MSACILIVDDNETNSYLLCFYAERLGHRTVVARSGPEALDLAATHKPDLVLLDLHMPQMDGFETAARLRKIPGLDAVPIVAVTANVDPLLRGRLARAGFAGCISKPIDTEAFPTVLQHHLAPPAP